MANILLGFGAMFPLDVYLWATLGGPWFPAIIAVRLTALLVGALMKWPAGVTPSQHTRTPAPLGARRVRRPPEG